MATGSKEIAHPVGGTVYLGNGNEAVLIVRFVFIFHIEQPRSQYAVTVFYINVIQHLIGDFLESVVARHGDVRCRVGVTTEDHGIIAVVSIVSGI